MKTSRGGINLKKLMILGAGVYQVPLIKTAKEMGIYTIVLSYKGKYPGFNLADKVYYTDTTNSKKVLELAQRENINGICTTGTDVAIASLGKVVSTMQLHGPSLESAQLVTNKYKMKNAFIRHGVRTAVYKTVTSIEEAHLSYELLKDFDSVERVVFKAVDSSGSRGIITVSGTNEIELAYRQVMDLTKKSYFIVEQFLDGIEFGAQALIYDKKVTFFIVHGDILHKSGSTTVPIGHYLPYEPYEYIIEDAKSQMEASIEATGINNCAFNVDYILCNDNVYMLEIGARAGATCLPELVECYTGIPYYREIVNLALGIRPQAVQRSKQPCAAQLICSDHTGTIKNIGLNEANLKGLLEVNFDVEPGDLARKFSVGPDRIGNILVKGDTVEVAREYLKIALNKIVIELEREDDR